jgi:hypothetical protein
LSSQWSLSFWLWHQYPICIPLLPHSCYMTRPFHPSWPFDLIIINILRRTVSHVASISMSSSQLSKAANLSEIGIWYGSWHFSAFCFFRLSPSVSNVCVAPLLTATLFLNLPQPTNDRCQQSTLTL